jgi:hypothetical protein
MEDPYNTQQNHRGEYGQGGGENRTGDNDNANSAMERHSFTNTGTVLASLSELAGRSFASKQEAVEAILRLIVDQLGLRSSLLTRTDREACQLEVVMAHDRVGGSEVPPGTVVGLAQAY